MLLQDLVASLGVSSVIQNQYLGFGICGRKTCETLLSLSQLLWKQLSIQDLCVLCQACLSAMLNCKWSK